MIKDVHETKQRETEDGKEKEQIYIGIQGGTTLCLGVHVEYEATGCTKLRCLLQLRLITTIDEVYNVRPLKKDRIS